MRLANTPSAKPVERSHGSAVPNHIASISLGTPGKVSTVKPGWMPGAAGGVQIMPGAVPVGFGNTAAPSGKNACLRLLGEQKRPRAPMRAWMSIQISGCSTRGVSKAAAIVSVVRSSGVGPRPPVVINTRQRPAASRTAAIRRGRLSPTTLWRWWAMPRAASCSASQRALPLVMLPSSSSVPMQRISALTASQLPVGRRLLQGPASTNQHPDQHRSSQGQPEKAQFSIHQHQGQGAQPLGEGINKQHGAAMTQSRP